MEHQKNQTLPTTSQEAIQPDGQTDRDAAWSYMEGLLNRAKMARDVYDPEGVAEWSVEEVVMFMSARCYYTSGLNLKLDDNNRNVFTLLCYYFSKDPRFFNQAEKLNVPSPSLDKGLLLAGGVGVGKTFLLKLFSMNMRQAYRVYNAKAVTSIYERQGADGVKQFNYCGREEIDSRLFYCGQVGLCIDDLGTEEREKVYMGNRRNVIGDIIESRYDGGNLGVYFHGTTNLTADQLAEHYGPRVASRLRQTMNLVELGGPDRRRLMVE